MQVNREGALFRLLGKNGSEQWFANEEVLVTQVSFFARIFQRKKARVLTVRSFKDFSRWEDFDGLAKFLAASPPEIREALRSHGMPETHLPQRYQTGG